MVVLWRSLVLFGIVSIFYFLPVAVRAEEVSSAPSIYFSEIGWSGSSISVSDEWLELKNSTDQPVNLAGWTISKWNATGSNQPAEQVVAHLDGIVNPSDVFLIASHPDDYNFTKGQSALLGQNIFLTKDVALSNSKLQLKLYNEKSELVDTAGDKDVPLAGTASPQASMARRLPLANGSVKTSWYTATVSKNFDTGLSDLGTPGVSNVSKPEITAVCKPEKYVYNQPIELECSGSVFDYDGNEVIVSKIDSELVTPLEILDNEWRWKQSYDGRVVNYIAVFRADNGNYSNDISQTIKSYQLSQDIVINELQPNGQEWIELYNKGSMPVNLSGWSLDDKIGTGSKAYIFSDNTILKPNTYMVIDLAVSGIILNNDGDEVNLIDPEDSVIHFISYDKSITMATYALKDNQFAWTTLVTAGTANLFPEDKVYPSGISISELLPNPDGLDESGEWVELENTSLSAVDISGWLLDDSDGGSRPYTFPAGSNISPQGYLVVPFSQSRIVLNNTKDTVRLFWPTKKLVSSVDYTDVIENNSYAFIDSSWQWTNQITPGSKNIPSQILDSLPVPVVEQAAAIGLSDESLGEDELETEQLVTRTIKKEILFAGLPAISYLSNGDSQGLVAGVSSRRDQPSLPFWEIFEILLFLTSLLYALWLLLPPSHNLKNLLLLWRSG